MFPVKLEMISISVLGKEELGLGGFDVEHFVVFVAHEFSFGLGIDRFEDLLVTVRGNREGILYIFV